MTRFRRTLLSALLLVFFLTPQGCLYDVTIKKNLDAVLNCSEVEVAADPTVTIFAGGGILWFDDMNAKAAFDARVSDGVGRRFAAALQRVLPDKRVYYAGRIRHDAVKWGKEVRSTGLCAEIDFYLEMHKRGGVTLHEYNCRLLPKAVPAVPRAVPGQGWGERIKGGLWVASKGEGSRRRRGGGFEYPLDFRSSVKWGWFAVKGSLSFAELEAAIFKWADRRSNEVAEELAESLEKHRSSTSVR